MRLSLAEPAMDHVGEWAGGGVKLLRKEADMCQSQLSFRTWIGVSRVFIQGYKMDPDRKMWRVVQNSE